jgi:hypothetical protein
MAEPLGDQHDMRSGRGGLAAGLVTSIVAGQSLGSWHANVFGVIVRAASRFTGAERSPDLIDCLDV